MYNPEKTGNIGHTRYKTKTNKNKKQQKNNNKKNQQKTPQKTKKR
jgi:hypothetical protein